MIFPKKVCSQPEIIFLGFKALCCKTDFSYISEKEVASLSKNGHFKNVHFLKIHEQVYSTVFIKVPTFCGNMWELCENYVVHNPSFHSPLQFRNINFVSSPTCIFLHDIGRALDQVSRHVLILVPARINSNQLLMIAL